MLTEAEVERYFSLVEAGQFAASWPNELNLLTHVDAEELTRKFCGHPMIDRLDGLVLDDPNTSNHHVLLRCPPLAGQILFLAHDDDSRVVFSSLQEFIDSARQVQIQDAPLTTFHPAIAPLAPNPIELAVLIRQLMADELVDVALCLIPSLDLSDTSLLIELAAHDDFFVAEAVAKAILARPSRALMAVATQCAMHEHPQAARAGRAACTACGR